MGVIIIIAVFWLLGLLMAWSMCVVAERADRRMEEIRHTHTDTDISRPADTGHAGRGRRPVRAMDGCHDDNAGDGRNNERTLPAENHRGGLPLRPHPHPIRAAAHAPKPVASTGRAV